MKTRNNDSSTMYRMIWLGIFMLIGSIHFASARTFGNSISETDSLAFIQYKGVVLDSESQEPLSFATLSIEGSNVATVTNADGGFILKVPQSMRDKIVLISYTGYKPKKILLTNLKEERTKILLEVVSVSLAEVSVFPQDPLVLIKAVLANQKTNFVQDERLMTAFYRESILKRKSYASLSEAVVEVYKQSYGSHRSDAIRLLKSRKSADYDKLDTVLFKLQGGPYNALMLDVMKDPNMIISYETMDMYDFKFVGTTRLNERLVYVLSFAQKTAEKDPLFYGKLFVDAESLALSSAAYSINLTNKDEASTLFIKKKPMGAKVYPTEANFMVNYRMQNGKWMYAYSRGDLAFKFNWDKKLFNTIYNVTYEMVVTNWVAAETKPFAVDNRLKMNVVMRDEAKGFGDDDFWGAYNVIEPEKTIEVAIKKIQKSIKELEK